MVNPSTLATAGGAVAAAVEAFAEVTGAAGGRAAAHAAAAPASSSIPLLLDPDFIRTMGRVFTTLRGRRSSTRVAGWAPAPSAAKTSSSKPAGTSFLSDPKLSIEEKLMRLLAYLSERWEKQMQEKMDQIAADDANAEGTGKAGSSSKSGGGIFGGIGDVLGGVFGGGAGGLGGLLGGGGGLDGMLGGLFDVLKIPGVPDVLGKVGGPVLAAAASALGFPMAAPAILQAAPALFQAVGSLASSGGGSGAGGSTGASSKASTGSSTSSSKSKGKMSDSQRQLLMMEIQRIYERQKEMFGIVSNILKSAHDTRMGVVHNMRG
jgi:hypothetical protein